MSYADALRNKHLEGIIEYIKENNKVNEGIHETLKRLCDILENKTSNATTLEEDNTIKGVPSIVKHPLKTEVTFCFIIEDISKLSKDDELLMTRELLSEKMSNMVMTGFEEIVCSNEKLEIFDENGNNVGFFDKPFTWLKGSDIVLQSNGIYTNKDYSFWEAMPVEIRITVKSQVNICNDGIEDLSCNVIIKEYRGPL